MEPYPSGQFGFIDDPDPQFGNGSVWTRTRTRSDGPEPLLTLCKWQTKGWAIGVQFRQSSDWCHMAIARQVISSDIKSVIVILIWKGSIFEPESVRSSQNSSIWMDFDVRVYCANSM